MAQEVKAKKLKVAWGITGAGDKISEIVEVMKELKKQSEDVVDIDVYISKAADTMLKFYRLDEEVKKSFGKVMVEVNANYRFLPVGCRTENMSSSLLHLRLRTLLLKSLTA